MKEKVKISIDLMGGDDSPEKTLNGIHNFIKKIKIKMTIFFIYSVLKIKLKAK